MSTADLKLRNKDRVSLFGVYGAAGILLLVIVAFCLLEGAFHTWAIGRYFAGRAGGFADVFLASAVVSVLTLILSCFATGRKRLIGVLASIITIGVVVLIFAQTT